MHHKYCIWLNGNICSGTSKSRIYPSIKYMWEKYVGILANCHTLLSDVPATQAMRTLWRCRWERRVAMGWGVRWRVWQLSGAYVWVWSNVVGRKIECCTLEGHKFESVAMWCGVNLRDRLRRLLGCFHQGLFSISGQVSADRVFV